MTAGWKLQHLRSALQSQWADLKSLPGLQVSSEARIIWDLAHNVREEPQCNMVLANLGFSKQPHKPASSEKQEVWLEKTSLNGAPWDTSHWSGRTWTMEQGNRKQRGVEQDSAEGLQKCSAKLCI